ncbi:MULTISPECIES: MFS transporter [Sphingobacterium]|jgi:MFS family permease|uniref:MFS transporter n=1 Tax=Sphingobacterium TaxID=28453 RepID=UPI0004E5F298|nr:MULTISPECIES: MFS transporter [Sphingobacterium]UPZ38680.1 MFS transporter [Sphingobacterium sp. PCS056]UXD70131.1 MFS transporter [Sphingobacterium faecium]WGQ13667.1 MFS transporter [Sphingobacterium faecium]CDS93814.1 Transporter [Sphingobacterium sp. PM2-P1-29]
MQIFRSLEYPNFRLHIIGQAISLMGTWMQRVAISWLVYKLTDSVFWLGFVSFISLLPSLVLSPFIGSFVDKHKKYRLVFMTQIGLMIQAGILTLLVYLKMETVLWLSILGFAQGVINAFDVLGRQSLMVHLVDNRKDLPNAIALNSSIFNAARMVGPAIGGILLSTYGEMMCFSSNFLSFIPVLITLWMMNVTENTASLSKGSNWQGLVEGFFYLKRSPHIFSLIIVMTFSSLLVIPYTSLLPAVAKEMFHGDAGTFSWFESAAGLGAMIGAINMARLKSGTNMRYQVMGAALLMGAALFLLGHSSVLVLALVYTAVVSFAMMMQNSSINTYIQTHAMPMYRARAISYYVMAFQGVFPIGSLLIGALASYFGLRSVLYFMGGAGILIAIAYYLYLRMHIHKRLFKF